MTWCILDILITLITYVITWLIPHNIWFSSIFPTCECHPKMKVKAKEKILIWIAWPGLMEWTLGALHSNLMVSCLLACSAAQYELVCHCLVSSAITVWIWRWETEAKESKWSTPKSQFHRIFFLNFSISYIPLFSSKSLSCIFFLAVKNVCYLFVDMYIFIANVCIIVYCVKKYMITICKVGRWTHLMIKALPAALRPWMLVMQVVHTFVQLCFKLCK